MSQTRIKPSQLTNYDGWNPAEEAWTYASASTITVPSGAASKYAVGDRIKWTQTTVKYGVIVTVADTLLTIAVNTDYVVTNAAISANFFSHQMNPVGYPHWFTWTPTWTASGSLTYTSVTSNVAKFCINGRLCNFHLKASGTLGGSASTSLLYTLPVAGVDTNAYEQIGFAYCSDTSNSVGGFTDFNSTSTTQARVDKIADANWATSGAGYVYTTGTYQI